MRATLFIAVLWMTVNGLAQQAPARPPVKWKYTGILQGGYVVGASGQDYSVQTIQGVQKGPWVLGIGAGIDNYIAPGFPVVAHGQYNYGKRPAQPFVYGQAGPHFPWAKNEWDEKFFDRDHYELKTGMLAEGGIGYRLPMGKKLKLITSLGYSYKQARYDEMQIPWTWMISSFWPPGGWPDPDYSENKMHLNRIVLKVGVQF